MVWPRTPCTCKVKCTRAPCIHGWRQGAQETVVEFVENNLTWNRLRKQGVVEADDNDAELHLDLDESSPVVALDVAATDHPQAGALPDAVLRVPRKEFGTIVEGVLHKLRITESVVIPVGRWRRVFEAVAQPMSHHTQWNQIDSAATVELNTRDPLLVLQSHHHLLRDLVNSVVTTGTQSDQGLSVAAIGVRLLIEVLPNGQMIIFAGDAALAKHVRTVVDQAAKQL